ncbi:integrase, partial [Escherichia coli]
MSMNTSPWNKDRIIAQKRPLQISHIWGTTIRLELKPQTASFPFLKWPLERKPG